MRPRGNGTSMVDAPSATSILEVTMARALILASLFISTTALAQPAPDEGLGLRNGFSLSVGQEFGTTAAGQDFSGQLYGFDWRIGGKITNAISAHMHTHLSL